MLSEDVALASEKMLLDCQDELLSCAIALLDP